MIRSSRITSGLLLVLAAVANCTSNDGGKDDSDDCPRGSESCPCLDGQCVGTLRCLSNRCVDDGTSGGSNGTGGTTGGTGGTTGGTGGTGASNGGTTSGSGGSSAGASGEGGAPDTGTGGGGSGNRGGESGGASRGGAGGAGGMGLGGASGNAGTGGSAGSSGTGGSGGIVATPQSNLPGVTHILQPDAAAEELVLLSSNLIHDTTSVNYVEWFGVVRNTGTEPTCQVRVTMGAETALTAVTGESMLVFSGYANADPYEGSINSSIPCIGPGKLGTFWVNDLPTNTVDVSAITTMRLWLFGNRYPGILPHSMAPTVTGAAITQHSSGGAGTWAATGQMTSTATIYNLAVDVDILNSDGLVFDRLTVWYTENFAQGTVWNFESENYYRGARPSDFLLFDEFRAGPRPFVELGPPKAMPAWAPRAAELAQRARDATAAQRSRRARALAARH